jgi:negative regulator of sigma-B (phosphoserine phosphatase)
VSIAVAHLSSPKIGESVNGDAVFVRRDDAGRVLLAIIDGLGHGPIAAEASQAAVTRLATASLEAPVIETVRMVHDALHRTRGAAATFCLIRGQEMESCAIGNVQLFC